MPEDAVLEATPSSADLVLGMSGDDAASEKKTDLQVTIVALHIDPPIMPHVKDHFPQVAKFPAVDLRGTSMHTLVEQGLISFSAYESAMRGRRWHKEFMTPGAVGLHQSNHRVLAEAHTPLLLLEEDCYLHPHFPEGLAAIRSRPFDVAVWGARIDYRGRGAEVRPIDGMPGWVDVSGQHVLFFCTHCVYYSERGREIVARHMQAPQEVQIDALLGILSMAGHIRLALQLHHHSAQQFPHETTIGHKRSRFLAYMDFLTGVRKRVDSMKDAMRRVVRVQPARRVHTN